MVEHLTDDDLQHAAARRPRLPQALRRVQDRGRARGQPDRDPRQDGQGLDARHRLRGAQRDAPDQEADAPTSSRCSATACYLAIPDAELEDGDPPYYHPGADSPEYEYMMARRRALDGSVPERVVRAKPLAAARRPTSSPSCSRAPARRCRRRRRPRSPGCCATCCATRSIGHARRADHPRRGAHVRPRRAVPRRSRSTRRSASATSRSTPSCCCRTARRATGASSRRGSPRPARWRRSPRRAPSYATWGQPMIPFFIFYSMFGFQRVGDLIWSFGDQRGPRLPARRDRGPHDAHRRGPAALRRPEPAARDSRSRTAAPTTPRSRTRWRVIVRDGIERMYGAEPEDCFYYLTLYNENYVDAADARGRRGRDRARPLPLPRRARGARTHRAQILASGTDDARRARGAAAARRASTTSPPTCGARPSYKLLREDALERRALEPAAPDRARRARRTSPSCSATTEGPIVAVTDFMKAVPDQIAPLRARSRSSPLGTDGYGFSDTRAALRRHFEVDAPHIVVAVLDGLAQPGDVKGEVVAEAIRTLRDRPRRARPPPHLTRLVLGTLDALRRGGRRRRHGAGRRPSGCVPRRSQAPRPASSSSSSSSTMPASSSSTSARVPAAFTEQAVVEALLQLARLTEPASSSFSGHASPTPDRASLIPSSDQLSRVSRVMWNAWLPHDGLEMAIEVEKRSVPVPVEVYHFFHRAAGGRTVAAPSASRAGSPRTGVTSRGRPRVRRASVGDQRGSVVRVAPEAERPGPRGAGSGPPGRSSRSTPPRPSADRARATGRGGRRRR